jgi:hypothetical protein
MRFRFCGRILRTGLGSGRGVGPIRLLSFLIRRRVRRHVLLRRAGHPLHRAVACDPVFPARHDLFSFERANVARAGAFRRDA